MTNLQNSQLPPSSYIIVTLTSDVDLVRMASAALQLNVPWALG